MRIVFLGTRGFPNVQGGVEMHCEQLTTQLAGMGCEIIVLTRKPYVDTSIKEYKGVRLISVPVFKHKSLEAFCHTLLGILVAKKFKPDILHIHGIGPGVFTPLARLIGMKVVLTTHGSNYEHRKWNTAEKGILRLFEYISIKTANNIIAVSEIISKNIVEKYNRTNFIIPNGVEFVKLAGSQAVLSKLNIERGKYILAVGRIVPEKGFSDLINAFCNTKLIGWKLVIVGQADNMNSYVSNLIKSVENNNSIIFAGFLTGKPLQELYSNAGLFILPSYYEGLSIALLEALSFGNRCIVSDIEANKYLELPEECYFPSGNITELGGKIIEFANNENKGVLSNEELSRIESKFSWSSIAQKTLDVYWNTVKNDC